MIAKRAAEETPGRPAFPTDTGMIEARARGGWIWIVLGCILLLLTPSLFLPLGPDQSLFFASGQKILRGALYYRDIVDVKPPLISYIYAGAIALFGERWLSIRLFDLLAQGGTCWLMMSLLRRATGNRRIAAMAPIIYLLLYFAQNYGSGAQPEGYVGLLGLGAIWLLAFGRGAWRYPAVGALCGALFLLKFPLGGMLAVAMLADALLLTRGAGRIVRQWLLMTAGFGAVAGLFLLYLLGNGIYHDFLLVNEFIRGYARTAMGAPGTWLRNLVEIPALHLSDNYSLLLLALTLAGGAISMRPPEPGPEQRPAAPEEGIMILRICTLGFILMMGTIIVEGKYAFYHFLRLYPFGAVMAAFAAAGALDRLARAPRRVRFTKAALALAVAALMLLSPIPRYLYNTVAVAWTALRTDRVVAGGSARAIDALPDGEAIRVGMYVRSHIAPGEKLFVAASMPGLVYYRAGVVPEFKILHFAFVNAPFAPEQWKRETSIYLLRERPRFIAAELNDILPDITGTNDPSIAALRRLPGIDALLRETYSTVLRTEKLELFERRDGIGEPAGPTPSLP